MNKLPIVSNINVQLQSIAIYNVERKELICIFESISLATKYLSNNGTFITKQKLQQYLSKAANNNGTILASSNILNLQLVIRFANKEQIAKLKNRYLLCVDYIPLLKNNTLLSFCNLDEKGIIPNYLKIN